MSPTFYETTFPYRILPVLLIVAAMIAGCSSPPKHTRAAGGGYYMDDGPGTDIPPGIENIPDAVPRIEPHNPANFRPYTVMGQVFVPVGPNTELRQRGVASWYGRKFHGQKTATGETYDMYAMTAAHPTLPLPSYARVTHLKSGRSIIVRVNDRGPFLRGRVIDLSYAAAAKLGIVGHGSDLVEVEAITHAQIRNGLHYASAKPAPATPAPAIATAATPQPAAAPAAGRPANPPNDTTGAATEYASTVPDALMALQLHARETQEQPAQATQTAQEQPAQAQAAPVQTAQAPAPTVTESVTDGIYLQFGAFSSYIAADTLANRLNREIAQVESRNVHVVSNDALHRVRLGPYPTRTAAVNAAVRIKEATGMQPVMAQR